MFYEIKRPFKVIKEQVFKKINIFQSSKEMMENTRSSIDKENARPPVAKGVSKSEFKRRYKGLFIHTCISLFVFAYTLLFLVMSQNLIAFVVSSALSAFFCSSYLLSLYRAWIARYYYNNWEKRFEPQSFVFRDFYDAISERPSILIPTYKIKKED